MYKQDLLFLLVQIIAGADCGIATPLLETSFQMLHQLSHGLGSNHKLIMSTANFTTAYQSRCHLVADVASLLRSAAAWDHIVSSSSELSR